VGESDTVENDTSEPDATSEADTPDTAEPPPPECPEVVEAPLTSGAGLLYSCIAVDESFSLQAIQWLPSGSTEPVAVAHVKSPLRLGTSLKQSDGYAIYDTVRFEGNAVVGRQVLRAPLEGGGEPELVLDWTPTDASFTTMSTYADSGLSLRTEPSADGSALALLLVDAQSRIGADALYVVAPGGAQKFVSNAPVSVYSWGPEGAQLAWVSEGTLQVANADGSDAVVVDPGVMKTPVAPAFLGETTLLYPRSKATLWRAQLDGTKEELGEPFPVDISWVGVSGPDSAVVLAGKALWAVDLTTKERTLVGAIEGEGAAFPSSVAPDDSGVLVGYALDNPFRSFRYGFFAFGAEGVSTVLGTEPGAGFVSPSAHWQ
jgi:hypothetical protein